MDIIGQKWKLPILWYIADAQDQTLRYRELERKVVGITPTMLTKCLRELEADGLIIRKQYSTIPPTVEYSLADRGMSLIPALESVCECSHHFPPSVSRSGGFAPLSRSPGQHNPTIPCYGDYLLGSCFSVPRIICSFKLSFLSEGLYT